MAPLRIHLLGAFQVALDGVAITQFRSDKVRALLVYLALEADRPHARASLCGLFWPEQSDAAALQNLSQTLLRLREALSDRRSSASFLQISRQSVQWNAAANLWLDASEFARLASSDDVPSLERAVALYRGELLPGFGLPGCPAFEEWLLLVRERLSRQAMSALETVAAWYLAQQRYAEAAANAHRQLALDPWREQGYRTLMRALAGAGDRAAALAAYERCRQIMRAELGVEPDTATSELAAAIRSETGAGLRPPTSAPAQRQAHLPLQLAPLIGRDAELAELAELLSSADARLLTIVGAGGMGKTHLAIELVRNTQAGFADGAVFVSLASLSSAAELPVTILRMFGIPPPYNDPVGLLLQTLRDKQLLLLLDNFEHLLDGAELVAQLLVAAPRLQIVATSRERLNMRGEQSYRVGGLAYAGESEASLPTLPAVQLFVQSARRVQPRFRLSAEDLANIAAICRMTLGMPLAIELAAAWVELLPLGEVAAQIGHSGDFLATELRDLPVRQRSMRAVFDWSWRLLRADEQQVFRRLAVFRGPFALDAAQVITGARPSMLLRLVGKSLLQVSGGRYEVHELLRQFADEQLDAAQERDEVQERHSQFYLSFVAERERRLFRDQPVQASQEVSRELDNIRQAWRRAAGHSQRRDLVAAACTLAQFYNMSGSSAEWEQLCQGAIVQLERHIERSPDDLAARRSLSILQALNGSACLRQGKHAESHAWAQRAIALGKASGSVVGTIHGLLVLGQTLRRQGESEQARAVLEQTAALARQQRQSGVVAELVADAEVVAYNWLCSIALTGDDYAAATAYVERGGELARRLHKTFKTMVFQSDLMDIAFATGDYAAARIHAEETLRLAREFGARRIESALLRQLAILAWLRGAYIEAIRLLPLAIECAHAIGDPVSVATASTELGYLWLLLGAYADAQRSFDGAHEALRAADMPARETQHHRLRQAQLADATGDLDRALAYASEAVQLAQQLKFSFSQAQALAVLGVAHARLGQAAQAVAAFEQALTYAEQPGGWKVALPPRVGLTEIALACGDLAAAQAHAQILWQRLIVERVQIEEPFPAHLACYRALAASGDPRAPVVLERAQRLLERYAEQIADPALRQGFLEHTARASRWRSPSQAE